MSTAINISDQEYTFYFYKLFTKNLLISAIKSENIQTRDRLFPLWSILATSIIFFFKAGGSFANAYHFLNEANNPENIDDSIFYRQRKKLTPQVYEYLKSNVLRCLADPIKDPYAFYKQFRLMAIDGSVFRTTDTVSNQNYFKVPKNQVRYGSNPLLRLVLLCELNTRAVVDYQIGNYLESEQTLAADLFALVPQDSLLIGDRAFHNYAWWQRVAKHSIHSLVRVQKGPKLRVKNELSDHSYITEIHSSKDRKGSKSEAIKLRIVAYSYTNAKGERICTRLATDLLDEKEYPAKELIRIYQERWGIEGIIREMKRGLKDREDSHLRSKTSDSVISEMHGFLLGYFVIRYAMFEAARSKGVSPKELSFQFALNEIKKYVIRFIAGIKISHDTFLKKIAKKQRKLKKRCCLREVKMKRTKYLTKKEKRKIDFEFIPRIETDETFEQTNTKTKKPKENQANVQQTILA